MAVKCSQHTKYKQREFQKYLDLHIEIVEKIINKKGKNWPYNYFGLTAGSGFYYPESGKPIKSEEIEEANDYVKGSPIIAGDTSSKYDLNLNATLFEQDPQCAKVLRGHCEEQNINSKVINKPWENSFEEIINKEYNKYGQIPRYGLIYIDPNGIPNFDKLGEISQLDAVHYLDIMIHISATNTKRVRSVHSEQYNDLKGYLYNVIKKKNWLIKSFQDSKNQQWCFLIGSNGALGEWQSEGFYSLDNQSGQVVFNHLNYTQDERNRLNNKTLFNKS